MKSDRQRLCDQITHVVIRASCVQTEVTVKHVPQIHPVLGEEGLVESAFNAVRFESFGSCCLAQCRVGGVNGRQRHDEEDEE